jgi:Antirestriction protein
MTCTCCQPLSEAQRVEYTTSLFGAGFPVAVEPALFRFAGLLSPEYTGGYREFYALSNGGFYMAPASDGPIQVRSENGFEGELSACAFGITICLYAFSQLSFAGDALALGGSARDADRALLTSQVTATVLCRRSRRISSWTTKRVVTTASVVGSP